MSVGEIVLKYFSRCIPVFVVFAGLAMVTAGCSDSRMAANNAAANSGESLGERTGYGTRSDGYSTDIATELKGSLQRAPRPQTAASGPVPVQQGQPATSAGAGGQQVAASGPAVVQQPAGPLPENPSPTAYGISSDGPTTDVSTWLFGPRNH
jgi:hypothetical protein